MADGLMGGGVVIPMGASDGEAATAPAPERPAGMTTPAPGDAQQALGTPANDQTVREQQQKAEPATATETPAKLLAGKYKSVEDLERGYVELEKQRGGQKPAAADSKDAADIKESFSHETLDRYGAEIIKDKKLSDESLHGLKTRGFSEQAINNFVMTFRLAHVASKTISESLAGGPEALSEKRTWLAGQPEQIQKTVNGLIGSGDPDDITAGMQMLNTLYGAENRPEPRLLQGSRRQPEPANQPFKSESEKLKAMENPLYWDHESLEGREYRASVDAKIRGMLDARRVG